jgi:Outer membrane lipoprotein-sorting protein
VRPAAAVVAAIWLSALAGSQPTAARAAPADSTLDGRAVMERAIRALYYPGHDMRARIRMEIAERGGVVRLRVMTELRLNLPEGEQRYLLYFHKPGDVRRMTCMVHKHVGRDDARWMFVPIANRVRRVTAPERSRFLGSDFVREEFSGRDAAADSHTVVRTEPWQGRRCYVLESVPREHGTEYARCTSWIDVENFLPLRQEFRGERGELLRVYTSERVKSIRGAGGARYPTPLVRTMANGTGKQWTRMTYESVAYDIGLSESDFSEAHMQEPLSQWLPEKGMKAKQPK